MSALISKHSDLPMEAQAAYALWQQLWQEMAALKKLHRPNFAPRDQWLDLERRCLAALDQYIELRKVEYNPCKVQG